jgi:type IV pilus assembly protein PilO
MKPNVMGISTSLQKIDFQKILDDFRHMNPNDPGSWQLVPRVAVLCGVFLLILILGWWFLWSDQLTDLENKQNEERTLKEQFIEKKRQESALLKQLPNKSEIEALLIEVNQAGLGRGLQFELFRPSQEQMKDFYAEMPIVVKVNGGYHDFGAFAADIGKLPRIVTLNNLAISPLKDGGSLTMDATIKTFRYLDDEEIAKQKKIADQKKAAQGAKK